MAIGWIIQRMESFDRESPAIIWDNRVTSYGEFLELVYFWREQEIKEGSVVAIEGDFSPKACALLLALIEKKTIIVPLTDPSKREEFVEVAEVQFCYKFDENDSCMIEMFNRQVTNPLTLSLKGSGLVLFTSGSSGKSKGALHDFEALLEKFQEKRHKRCTITFLVLDHMGGINTLFYTLSNGGTVVSIQSRNPEYVCKIIEKHKVELLPTTPTFLNMLLMSESYTRHDTSSLKQITYGTETMPKATLERLRNIFPNVALLQTYGLTELGILRSKSRDSSSLWMRVGGEGFATKVKEGTLWIKAKSAMLGYLNAPNPFDEEGWMNTGDIVEVDGDYIRILGRQTDIINVGGQKVHPAEVENIIMQMDNIRDVTIYGADNPITGNIVAARITLFEFEELSNLKKRVRIFCKDKLANYKIPIKVEVVKDDQFSARYKKIRSF